MIPSKVIKIGDSIKLTTINTIHHYGLHNTIFITMTLRGENFFASLLKKYNAFMQYLPKSIKSAITVFGFGPRSLHMHMVAFVPSSITKGDLDPLERLQRAPGKKKRLTKLRNLIIRAKRKAKLGRVFNIQAVRNAEAIAGYLRRNYLDTDEYRNRLGPSSRSKFRGFRYYRVPEHLKISPKSFSRHTPSASRYRCVMTGLAQCVGTPIGDVRALEDETGLSFEQLRHVAFGLCNTTPGNPKKWPPRLFAKALSEAGSNHNQFKINRKAKK